MSDFLNSQPKYKKTVNVKTNFDDAFKKNFSFQSLENEKT